MVLCVQTLPIGDTSEVIAQENSEKYDSLIRKVIVDSLVQESCCCSQFIAIVDRIPPERRLPHSSPGDR